MDQIEALNDLIGKDAYWQVNKKIAKHFQNNDTAILLSDFISKQKYFSDKNELVNGFFYNTSENIENDCNISYHKQKTCINQLIDSGFLETWRGGLPAKLHFKINVNSILNFLISSIGKIQKLDLEEFETNKNKINNNKVNKNKDNITRPQKFDFKKSLIEKGFEPKLVDEWLLVRKTKKAVNTETAFENFLIEVDKTNIDKNKLLKFCISKSWGGFKASWDLTELNNMERDTGSNNFVINQGEFKLL